MAKSRRKWSKIKNDESNSLIKMADKTLKKEQT